MQASPEELTSSPSLNSGFCDEFSCKMKLVNDFDLVVRTEKSAPSDEEREVEEEEDGDEEEFSFACAGADDSPIAAEDAFQNGQIKPVFPLFDQSLLYVVGGGNSVPPSEEDLPRRPPVKKVFVETEEGMGEEAAGPYCAWSSKAVVEVSPETCKKSNSTGFSKIWRFRELSNRSNSDGRDAFVFLNNGSSTTTRSSKVEKTDVSSAKKSSSSTAAAAAASEAKVNSAPAKLKAKKGKKKGETSSLSSAHELHYVKNRASREEDRRRSYLPYRPELVGFFTNVNGGLSRNIHPF